MKKTRPYLELCVRSLGGEESFARQERVVDRLQSLEAAGAIEGYGVTVMGESIRPRSNSGETTPGRDLRHKLFIWDLWCRRNGANRSQLFRVDGLDEGSIVHTAPLVLVEFDRSRVRFISPFDDGDQQVSVTRHLDSLVTDAPRRVVPRTDAITVEDPARSGWHNGPRQPDEDQHIVEEEHLP